MSCLKGSVAIVGYIVVEGKLCSSRTQWEIQSIVPRLTAHRSRRDHKAGLPRTRRQNRIKPAICRQEHFKRARTGLRPGRGGFVLDFDEVRDMKQASVGNKTEDFDAAANTTHSPSCVKHLDGEGLTHGSLLIVTDSLVNDTHQIRFVRVSHTECKRSLCVGLRACFRLYCSIQPNEDHFISGSGLAAALIADRAGDASRRECSL